MASVTLKHPVSKETKTAPLGFSWMFFFLGCITCLIRSDWKWAGITLLAGIFSVGISHFVFMFIYNKLYITDLLNNGFKPTTDADEKTLKAAGFVIPS